jgi:hypothetical protein
VARVVADLLDAPAPNPGPGVDGTRGAQ